MATYQSQFTGPEIDEGVDKGRTAAQPNTDVSFSSVTLPPPSQAVAPVKGQAVWNEDAGTVDLGLNSVAEKSHFVGQEVLYRVNNATGSTIPAGTAVMAAGSPGQSGVINVAPAVADGSVPARFMIGIAKDDILDGEFGYVAHFGRLRGLDTSAFSAGDVLYIDPAVPGGLTATTPVAPNLVIPLAFVINSHASVGTLMVRVETGETLAGLHDTDTTGATDGQVLVYNETSGLWEPEALPAASNEFRDLDVVTEVSNNNYRLDTFGFANESVSGTLGANRVIRSLAGFLTQDDSFSRSRVDSRSYSSGIETRTLVREPGNPSLFKRAEAAVDLQTPSFSQGPEPDVALFEVNTQFQESSNPTEESSFSLYTGFGFPTFSAYTFAPDGSQPGYGDLNMNQFQLTWTGESFIDDVRGEFSATPFGFEFSSTDFSTFDTKGVYFNFGMNVAEFVGVAASFENGFGAFGALQTSQELDIPDVNITANTGSLPIPSFNVTVADANNPTVQELFQIIVSLDRNVRSLVTVLERYGLIEERI